MMRFGVGLGVVAMLLGVSASAVADEDTSAKAKEADATVEAKDDKKGELDGLSVGTEDLKAKKNKQVAQAGTATAAGNTQRRARRPEEADEPEKKKPSGLPARIPWRGTAVSWSNDASASAIGVGDDFQGRDFQQYTQTFGASLNYFVIDQKNWSLAVQATPSFTVELTNSGITTTEREPQFNDLPVNVVYRRLLYSEPGTAWATGLVLRARAFLPTNPTSYNAGTYLRTQPAVVMWQSLPGIPKDVAPVLNSWVIGAVANWTYRFGDSTTPVNTDLANNINRVGNNSTTSVNPGDAALDQNIQLSGSRFDTSLGQAVFLFLSQPIGPTLLQISSGFTFTQRFLPAFNDDGVECPLGSTTGCDPNFAENLSNAEGDRQFNYGFFFSGSFFPVPEAGINFGYASIGNQLGTNGQRENIFYAAPLANFNVGLALSVDAIYEALTGPRRARPFILVAQKKKDEDEERTQPKKGIRNPTGL